MSNTSSQAGTNQAQQADALHLLIEHFMQTEQYNTAELQTYQLRAAKALIEHCREYNDWYADRLADIDLSSEQELLQTWRRLPLLTREDLQNNREAMRSKYLPENHGETKLSVTSGSTGKPVGVWRSDLNGLYWNAITMRDHIWHNRDFFGRLAAVRFVASDSSAYSPDGQEFSSWGVPVDMLGQSGPAALLPIDIPVNKQLHWLERQSPKYLLSYPSNLRALADKAEANGSSFPSLEQIRTVSEALDDETRARIESVFKAPVVDAYSSEEVGYIALQCPEHNHYHIQAESVWVEILNEHGRPCKPGETGRIIVTDLHNYAMPIIRYDIGDYAQLGDTCDCGRGLPVIKRILGRVRNMLITPDGDRLWPNPYIAAFSKVSGQKIRQAQLIQTRTDTIEVVLATDTPLNTTQESVLIEFLQDKLHYDFNFQFTYCDEIKRSASGKFEEFKSNIATAENFS